jgi:hypothetical protein
MCRVLGGARVCRLLFGRHVDAGRRRLYSLPCVSISLCLYSCIASDGRVDGWLGVMRFDERYLVT